MTLEKSVIDMLKIAGMIAIVISTSLFGISKADKLKRRRNELNLISHMLEDFIILIRFKALPLFEIVKQLKSNKLYKDSELFSNIDCSLEKPFYKAWEESIDNMHTYLNSNDLRLLKSFGSTLGRSDIEGELSNIEIYKSDFLKLEKSASEECEKKSQLYRSLGVLSGVFISILLI